MLRLLFLPPLLLCFLLSAQTIDPDFRPHIMNPGPVTDILPLEDGRLYVTGEFQFVNDQRRAGIVRLRADGSVDHSFQTPPEVINVQQADRQADGKLILRTAEELLRLQADGALDETFQVQISDIEIVQEFQLLPDGKILITGQRNIVAPTLEDLFFIRRLLPDGQTDTTFQQPEQRFGILNTFIADTAGGVWITGNIDFGIGPVSAPLIHLLPDGSLDTDIPYDMLSNLDPGFGELLVRPASNELIAFGGGAIRIFTPSGDLFFILHPPGGVPRKAMMTTSGEVYYGDGNTYLNGENSTGLIPRNHLYRLTTLNQLFRLDTGSGADNPIDAVGLQANGTLYFGGRFSTVDDQIRKGIAKLNADGRLEDTFSPDILSPGLVRTVLPQGDKVIVGGLFYFVDGRLVKHLARLDANGRLDTTFNLSAAQHTRPVYGITQLDGGNLLVSSQYRTGAVDLDNKVNGLQVLTPDGAPLNLLDFSYRPIAGFFDLHPSPPGAPVYLTGFFDFSPPVDPSISNFARLSPDLMIDTNFIRRIDFRSVWDVLSLPDGETLILGRDISFEDQFFGLVLPLNPEDNPVPSFQLDPTLSIVSAFRGAALPDGGIALVGEIETEEGIQDGQLLVRLNDDGSLDDTFQSGRMTKPGSIRTLHALPGERLLISGPLQTYNGLPAPSSTLILDRNGTVFDDFGGRVSGYFRTIREKDVETLYAGGQIALLDGPLSAGLVRIELTPTSRDPEPESRPLPFRLHPNPVTEGVLQLRLESPLSSDASYQLLSADGRSTLVTGIIPAGASAVELSLAHLPKGVFFLVMTSEGKQKTVRVVKQ